MFIQIEFPMDIKTFPKVFSYIEELLNNDSKYIPLRKKIHLQNEKK